MRGKVLRTSPRLALSGITPAYAGKSHSKRTREKINGDHPRLCGEKAVVGNYNRIFVGSPPPMRGKEVVHDQKDLHGGITPAYAGKSDFHDAHLRFFEDHPRLCGEKGSNGCNFPVLIGSPPPMRGKANRSTIFCTLCGITPAYAGKRSIYVFHNGGYRDHPRLCGEKRNFRTVT